MPFQRAGQLARETPTARPQDPLGLVAENLRESHYGAIPVIEGGLDENGKVSPNSRVVGIIFETDLTSVVLPVLETREVARMARAPIGHSGGSFTALPLAPEPSESADLPIPHPGGLNGGLNGHANGHSNGHTGHLNGAPPGFGGPRSAGLHEIENLKALDVMQEHVPVVPSLFSLHNALLTLDRYQAPALPVVDEFGQYRGMVGRADIVAALGSYVRPPVVGGMATPLGVWLTTGHISAGAPAFGLFLSGFTLGLLLTLAHYLLFFALMAMDPQWGAMFLSGRIGILSDSTSLFNIIVTLAEGGLFLLLMRLTPLAGIHAAEHQTVWAIERGVPLEPEYVKTMPRAHPRCGTNLMALAGLVKILMGHMPSTSPTLVLLAMVFVFFFWRNLGTALQVNFTTRPASPKQLEDGIRAGKAIMQKYQEQPHALTSFGSRLFNSGLLFAMLGMIAFTALAEWFADYAARFVMAG